MSFKTEQYLRVEKLIKNGFIFYGDKGNGIFRRNHYPFVLKEADNNLFEPIRYQAKEYFKNNKIAWWGGRLTNHTLSSLVSCVNHLFPIRHDKNAVLAIVKQFVPSLTEVLPISTDSYMPAYIQFEAVSDNDHLNESYSTRGSNCTSVDALIYGLRDNGNKIMFPIEWKFIEVYDNTDKALGEKGEIRKSRYTTLIDDSAQLKSKDHSIFYFEPFYQLMRQTLWAEQMIKHSNTETISADEYLHIHIIPAENKELLAKKYKYSNEGLEETWRSCIKNQDKYIIVTPKDLLSKIQNSQYAEVLGYLNKRYW